jgi:beta-mannosidase
MISLDEGRPRLSLDGSWKYQLEREQPGESLGYTGTALDTASWPEMLLPVNWYLTEVGDFFGTVWFRRGFEVPEELAGARLFLRFGGVDYFADVWLNGRYLGSHEGMFNPFEFDVTDKLEYQGPNQLVVKVGAPRDETEYVEVDSSDSPLTPPYRTHQATAISLIKGHMIDAMHRPGAMTSFRSDGNSGGIWDSVDLVARPVIYIDYFKVISRIGVKKDWTGDQLDKPDGTALVTVHVTAQNTSGETVEGQLELSVTPYNFEGGGGHHRNRRVVLPPGRSTHKIVLTIPEARLWWTWDHGRPDLYTALISLAGDSVIQNFGVKEVVRDPSTGYWHLNGRRVFLRGMRYISSNWMSEANEKRWSEDLAEMLDMQINSIRIGSHVEKDGFYTLCDEMGILVWQVFPLHYCVSDEDDMIERAAEMIEDMGLMLHNHASIGMWSVFKEPEVYLLPDVPNNYHRICPVLKETLRTVDPERWIHLGDYREGVLNLMIGLCWPGDTDLSEVQLVPDIVEFGAGSIPVRESLEQFIPLDKLWPPDWDTWEYYGFFHDLSFGFAKLQMADTLDEFIEDYQRYEALVVKEQMEYIRQHMYDPVGSMYLYYWSDPVPMMGSGVYDYYRRRYEVFESLMAAYTRVFVSLEREETPYIVGRPKVYQAGATFSAKVWVNNDYPHDLADTDVTWHVVRVGDGAGVINNTLRVDLAADSATVVDRIDWAIRTDAAPGAYRVEMRVAGADGTVLSSNSTEIAIIGTGEEAS